MAHSMTGFARYQVSGPWGVLTWEARSVNHRYLDVRFRLPEVLHEIEPQLKQTVSETLGRGKVDISAELKLAADNERIDIDQTRLRALFNALEQVRELATGVNMPDALDLLEYPGIQQAQAVDETIIQQAAADGLIELLKQLQAMRGAEGQRLVAALEQRALQIGEYADKAAERLPAVKTTWEAKLKERLAELNIEAEPGRLEQELVFTAQRLDVAEELDRLHSHIAALTQALALEEPIGRRLDFLMQEFNREANTLSSKSQDAQMTGYAVEMKVLIEQMREQVQNIE